LQGPPPGAVAWVGRDNDCMVLLLDRSMVVGGVIVDKFGRLEE
jgi:hypothetical protein